MLLVNEMVTVVLPVVLHFDSPSLTWADVSGDGVERLVLFRPTNLRFIIQTVQLGQSPRITCMKHHQELGSVFKRRSALYVYPFQLISKICRSERPNGKVRCFRREPK